MTTALLPELYCSNFDRTLSFYVDTLGFSIMYIRTEDKFMRIERQGTELMLEEYDPINNRVWLVGDLEHPYGRGISFQIATTNVDDLYQKVKTAKAKIFLPMEEKWYRADSKYLGNRQFIVQDPDGYLLRFAEDLGAKDYAPS